jgi:uncharacterized membrane protein
MNFLIKKIMKKIRFVKMIVLATIAITTLCYLFMWLWNVLIPELFKGPSINFLQAVGLLVLSKILFGGMWHRGRHHWKQQWRSRMQEKMNAMTPEEREKFKQEWSRRCGKFGKWNSGEPINAEPYTHG